MFNPWYAYTNSKSSSLDVLCSRELDNQRFQESLLSRQEEVISACRIGNQKRVKKLLKSSLTQVVLNPNFIYEMQTPLCASVEHGHDEVTKLLISHRAQVDMFNGRYKNPLILAIQYKRGVTVKLLIENGAKLECPSLSTTILHLAAGCDDLGILSTILQHSSTSQINWRDKAGKTPLFKAIELGNAIFAKLLVSKGADTTLADNNGVKPLDIVVHAKEMSEKKRSELTAILVNPIQVISNRLVILLRQHKILGNKCNFVFDSILQNLLFNYASSKEGRQKIQEVGKKSLTSKTLINYVEVHKKNQSGTLNMHSKR